jgi:hypothetical protein
MFVEQALLTSTLTFPQTSTIKYNNNTRIKLNVVVEQAMLTSTTVIHIHFKLKKIQSA